MWKYRFERWMKENNFTPEQIDIVKNEIGQYPDVWYNTYRDDYKKCAEVILMIHMQYRMWQQEEAMKFSFDEVVEVINYLISINPYPENIFPEPSKSEIEEVHRVNEYIAGRIFAHGGRLAWIGALLRLKEELNQIIQERVTYEDAK